METWVPDLKTVRYNSQKNKEHLITDITDTLRMICVKNIYEATDKGFFVCEVNLDRDLYINTFYKKAMDAVISDLNSAGYTATPVRDKSGFYTNSITISWKENLE